MRSHGDPVNVLRPEDSYFVYRIRASHRWSCLRSESTGFSRSGTVRGALVYHTSSALRTFHGPLPAVIGDSLGPDLRDQDQECHLDPSGSCGTSRRCHRIHLGTKADDTQSPHFGSAPLAPRYRPRLHRRQRQTPGAPPALAPGTGPSSPSARPVLLTVCAAPRSTRAASSGHGSGARHQSFPVPPPHSSPAQPVSIHANTTLHTGARGEEHSHRSGARCPSREP